MRKIALIEFHFDFFLPLFDYFEKAGLLVDLWTSHTRTLEKLPKKVLSLRSRYAQLGLTPRGERVSGVPDDAIIEALSERREMILNQARRFSEFAKWDDAALWRHILAMAEYWDQLIRQRQIDVFLYKTEPHMLFDFVLYCVAKVRGRTNLFFERLPFDNRVVVCENLEDMRGEINHRLNCLEAADHLQEYSDIGDPAKNDEGLPFHYKFKRDRALRQKKDQLKVKLNKFKSVRAWPSLVSGKYCQLLRKKELWESVGANASRPIRQSTLIFAIGAAWRYFVYQFAYKNALSLCNAVLFRGRFQLGGILFCLQCQPERSTNPCGGPQFFDQVRLIKELSSILGPNRRLFVKEHPSQFSSYQLPEKGRSFRFYYELAKLKNVVLLPPLPTAEKLLETAGCLVSVGGSAGWRALKKGVPAIICGQVGYSGCRGAFPGRTKKELKESIAKIEGLKPPVASIIAAADAFESSCARISSKGYLDTIYAQKFDENYDNALVLCQLVVDFLENRSLRILSC